MYANRPVVRIAYTTRCAMVECLRSADDELARIRRYRESFLAGDEPGTELPDQLSAAWRRALFLGARPDRDSLPVVEVRPDSPLVAAASPVLARLMDQLAETEVSAVLSDAQARILRCWSAGWRINAHLERIQTRPGADLSEGTAGNNGINEVLGNKRRGLIEGPQHILGLYQQTVCTGAQLRNPVTGQIAGAISLVCDLDSPRHLLTALTDSTATAIETELLRAAAPRERVLADAYTENAASGEAIVVLDGHTRITSPAAASVLTEQDINLLQAAAAEATRQSCPRARELALRDGVHAYLRPIWQSGEMCGVSAAVRQETGASPERAHRAPTRARDASSAWREAASSAHRLTRDGIPVLLVGEPGTGKTTLGTALAGAGGGHVLDARLVAADGEQAWLARLREAIGDPGSVVVLSHVEALPETSADAVLALLSGSRFVATYTARRQPGLALGALLDYCATGRVWLPPLRDRAAEIPGLMREFAPDGAAPGLTLQAQQALQHYRWPGNLTELRQVTSRLVAQQPTERPIELGQLPDEISQCARGRTLSAMESAEYATIREALRRHNGNRLQAAKSLGIARATLYRKLKQYSL
ncbi:MAG: hypothetical protein GEU98_21220 [Pseudonocardiaceae bacterium]|nr:hypothetical protein [Pseudonocardiaceae bacterium]